MKLGYGWHVNEVRFKGRCPNLFQLANARSCMIKDAIVNIPKAEMATCLMAITSV